MTSVEDVRPPNVDESRRREEEIERAFDRIVRLGVPRLQRSTIEMLATGAVGGLDVGFGVLALLYVEHVTGSILLGGLAFSIGFLILQLGQSELFTEGFLVPVVVVVAEEARLRSLFRLWGCTLVANLAGGWVLAAIAMTAFPQLQRQAVRSASYYAASDLGWRTLCLAILAGAAITLMTWMHTGTANEVARVFASVATAFLLAGMRMFHSILDSLLIFTALQSPHAPFGYGEWFEWFSWVMLGNLIGGIGLVTMLRLVRANRRVSDHREAHRRRLRWPRRPLPR
ncbi:MAG: formate/nitrite transporter family protein [Acidimicrobiales bacterium]